LCFSCHYAFPAFSSCARTSVFTRARSFFASRSRFSASACPSKLEPQPENHLRQLLILRAAVRPRPLRGSFQFARASLKPSRAGHELRGNRQLVRRQPHGFLGRRFVHSRHLEHDASRLHHRHPLLRRAFCPCPCAFPAGFLVNGLSGKIRIHNFPPRLMNRVIATRDASICRSVIHAHSMGLQTVLAERQISAAPGLAGCGGRASAFCTSPSSASTSLCSRFPDLFNCFPATAKLAAFSVYATAAVSRFLLNLRSLLGHVFALVDPALHANYAVSGVGFRGAEINVRAQRLQRQPPLQVPFLARDFPRRSDGPPRAP